MKEILSIAYAAVLIGMMFFAVHRLKMIYLYARHSRRRPPPPPLDPARAPKVCIQCPLYNEPLVVTQLLEKVTAIRWPAGKLEIQILDDSDDDTTASVADWLAARPDRAAAVRHIRRPDRGGYKAGALAHGMTLSDAEFFAIFDADFLPEPGFLETLMPRFADPKIAVVQARWDFANRHASLVTRFQGIFLDAHFVIEQEARHASGRFFNFNGTAGIWRRAALEDAGGWSADTVTEDLDLSYRAQLRGWKFVYLPDYAVASELPENMTAFKSQQRRWAKGAMQVARRQLRDVLAARLPLKVKTEAVSHLLVGLVHPVLLAFALLFVPYLVLRDEGVFTGFWNAFDPLTVLLLGCGTAVFYITAQYLRRREWREAALWFLTSPLMLAFGLALSVSCCFAVVEGLFLRGGEFVRTPKGGKRLHVGSVLGRLRARSIFAAITVVELLYGALMLWGMVHFLDEGDTGIAIVLAVKAAAFCGMALLTAKDLLARPRPVPQAAAAPAKA
ncbi:MAG: glycosyltransferase [Opitutaceae bacterium]|jgi:cellulose synthase/poly-beta-1,6-N-acetylglucosamine synthase-like glycosyltransferase|nr:glycosyltransferase [Opitutaceae bacterium]